MPNWATNRMKVTDLSPSEAIEFSARINDGTLFQHFIPTPSEDELPYSDTIPANARKRSMDEVAKIVMGPDSYDRDEYSEDQLARLDKYGVISGYEWQAKNWGVKWGIDEDGSEAVVKDGNVFARFNTPWGWPLEGLVNISKMFPKAAFQIITVEEGCDDLNSAIIHNGAVKQPTYGDYTDSLKAFISDKYPDVVIDEDTELYDYSDEFDAVLYPQVDEALEPEVTPERPRYERMLNDLVDSNESSEKGD